MFSIYYICTLGISPTHAFGGKNYELNRGGFRGGVMVTCHHYNLWVMVHPPPPPPTHTHTHKHTHNHISHFLPPRVATAILARVSRVSRVSRVDLC